MVVELDISGGTKVIISFIIYTWFTMDKLYNEQIRGVTGMMINRKAFVLELPICLVGELYSFILNESSGLVLSGNRSLPARPMNTKKYITYFLEWSPPWQLF